MVYYLVVYSFNYESGFKEEIKFLNQKQSEFFLRNKKYMEKPLPKYGVIGELVSFKKVSKITYRECHKVITSDYIDSIFEPEVLSDFEDILPENAHSFLRNSISQKDGLILVNTNNDSLFVVDYSDHRLVVSVENKHIAFEGKLRTKPRRTPAGRFIVSEEYDENLDLIPATKEDMDYLKRYGVTFKENPQEEKKVQKEKEFVDQVDVALTNVKNIYLIRDTKYLIGEKDESLMLIGKLPDSYVGPPPEVTFPPMDDVFIPGDDVFILGDDWSDKLVPISEEDRIYLTRIDIRI